MYVDGGIRIGIDVFKVLVLGVRVVFIGRLVIWGLVYKVIMYFYLFGLVFIDCLGGFSKEFIGLFFKLFFKLL